MAMERITQSTPVGTSAQNDVSERAEHEALAHILPGWFQAFQDWAFLPLMVIAEMLINGVMMASGLVGNVNNPFAGGASHWLGEAQWSVLFLAGAIMGGMALRTSAAASYWFSRNRARACFNVMGMLFFATIEIWASVMERSYTPILSPADSATLGLFGIQHPSVSITDVIVAFALPLAAIWWGFSTMKLPSKSAEEVQAEGARKLAEAVAKAQVRQAQATGWGATLRAGAEAAFARNDGGVSPAADQIFTGEGKLFGLDNPSDDAHSDMPVYEEQDGERGAGVSSGKDGHSSRNLRAIALVGGVPYGWLDAASLAAWLRQTMGVETSPGEALAFIRAQPSARRCLPEEHVQGRPWIAQKPATLAAARRKWGAKAETQISGA